MARLGSVLLSWAVTFLAAAALPGQTPSTPGTAERAIVVVRVTATSLEGATVGQPVRTLATGWFADAQGHVVTAHHVIDKLGRHDPSSRVYEVLLSPGDSHPLAATVVNEDASHDLLLLTTGTTPTERGWLRFRGTSSAAKDRDAICYIGFRELRSTYQSRCDTLVRTSGIAVPGLTYLWDTGLDSAEGLSGAPVYEKDCPLIAAGVVKGKDPAFASSALVVPSIFLRLFPELTAYDGPCPVGDGSADGPAPPVPVTFASTTATAVAGHPAIRPDRRLRLVQMEPYGPLSGYIRENNPGGVTRFLPDPYHSQMIGALPGGANPVFNVILENSSDQPVVVTSVLYRVQSVTQYLGATGGPLIPDARYHLALLWQAGDQVASLVPGYLVPAKSLGSFLLELTSAKAQPGLAWTMQLYFRSDQGSGVTTEKFELVMSKR